MRLVRSGSRRFCGEKVLIDAKNPEIKDLKVIFTNVPDLNSRSRHDYTLSLSDEELRKLWEKRRRRREKSRLIGTLVEAKARKDPEEWKRLKADLDSSLQRDRDRELFGLKRRSRPAK